MLLRGIMFCMDWSQKRKILYAVGFTVIIILLVSYPAYLLFYKAPTCFDAKQNGEETGVDCGGGCALVCAVDVKAPRIVWAKTFSINGGYDIGAYVENINPNAGIKNAHYTARVFDSNEVIIAEKKGNIDLIPLSAHLIFETGVIFSGTPDRTEVSFDSGDLMRWTRASQVPSPVVTKNQNLKNVDTEPRFNAVLVNTDQVSEVSKLTLGAIIYDPLRNPIAISKTYVNRIPKGGEQDIFFVWHKRFTKHPQGGMCTSPVDTILVFDRSGSMDIGGKIPPEPLTTAKNAANTYINFADIVDKVGIVSFAGTATTPIDHELSTNHDAVKKATARIEIEKGSLQYTNLGDALIAAISELKGANHTKDAKQVIVALTDGISNRPLDQSNPNNKSYSEDYAVKAAEEAKANGVQVYAIGLGNGINEAFLRDRISSSPTQYFNAPTADSLQNVYKKISETVCKPENFITEIIVTPQAVFKE
ncbi:MAG TPA: hypothetical protein DCS23_03530 [Candidatus Yonathbacteria bacterium]|nr:hypothetical protein [Candidatus Yonathbacteria bacterium]